MKTLLTAREEITTLCRLREVIAAKKRKLDYLRSEGGMSAGEFANVRNELATLEMAEEEWDGEIGTPRQREFPTDGDTQMMDGQLYRYTGSMGWMPVR